MMKEVLKSSEITIQVEEKRTNINLVNITTKENDKSVEVKTYADVAAHMVKIPSEYFVPNSTT